MNTFARSALIGFFVICSGVPARSLAEYHIYRDAKGVLVISNQKPPEGSQIIGQRTLPAEAGSEPARPQNGNDPPSAATPTTKTGY